MYPNVAGSRFDWDYYLGPHLDLARRILIPHGLVRIEVDRGLGAFPPGAPPPFHAVGHLFFRTLGELQAGLAATAPELIADAAKYSQGQSVVMISEVFELA